MPVADIFERHVPPSKNPQFSGFQFATGTPNQISEFGYGGRLTSDPSSPAVGAHTLFDLASISKLYTAALAAKLHAAGTIDLNAPIGDWSEVPEALSSLSSMELLTHTSGLPPEWIEAKSRSGTIESLLQLVPDERQRGQLVYSCTGYSLFSILLERHLAANFDSLIHRELLAPLRLSETMFNPLELSDDIAEAKGRDERIPRGVVHDPRARAMDGVSGNAGLFANAQDVFGFLSELMTGSNGVIGEEARKLLFTPRVFGDWEQCVGFRFNDAARTGSASHFHSHSGFTGTLAIIDEARGRVGVMLTNRLSFGTNKNQMAVVYRDFAGQVAL